MSRVVRDCTRCGGQMFSRPVPAGEVEFGIAIAEVFRCVQCGHQEEPGHTPNHTPSRYSSRRKW